MLTKRVPEQDKLLRDERTADNTGSMYTARQRLRGKRNTDSRPDHLHHFLRGQYVVQFTNRNPQRLRLIHQGAIENRI